MPQLPNSKEAALSHSLTLQQAHRTRHKGSYVPCSSLPERVSHSVLASASSSASVEASPLPRSLEVVFVAQSTARQVEPHADSTPVAVRAHHAGGRERRPLLQSRVGHGSKE